MATLELSTPDDITLTYEVSKRLLDLADAHLRIRGVELAIPIDMQLDFVRFQQVKQRHINQDYRHMDAEMRSVKAMAQWSLDVNCALRNQPRKQLTWKD